MAATTTTKKNVKKTPCGCKDKEHSNYEAPASGYFMQHNTENQLLYRLARLEAIERQRENDEIEATILAERKKASTRWMDGFLYGAAVAVWTVVLVRKFKEGGFRFGGFSR